MDWYLVGLIFCGAVWLVLCFVLFLDWLDYGDRETSLLLGCSILIGPVVVALWPVSIVLGAVGFAVYLIYSGLKKA